MLQLCRWKETMLGYFDAMHDVGMRVVGLLATGLGLGPDFFEGLFEERASSLRLLHYSAEVLDVRYRRY